MIEIIAVIFTLVCVILTIKSNIWCWPTGIIATIAYLYVFHVQHLYLQEVLQVIFILQSLFGWYYWNKHKKTKHHSISPERLVIDLFITLILTILFTSILAAKTDNPEPALDTITTLLSLLGTWYLAKKNKYGWFVYIVADIFFIVMFMTQDLYYSAALYFLLLLLAIKGLIQWTKNSETA